MPHGFLIAIAALFVLDVAVRPWSKSALAGNATYLLLAYVPMVAVPFLSAWEMTALIGAIALFSHFNYARMVGLTGEPRFFLTSLVCTAAFFAVARVHWYALFQAMPVFAIGLVIAVASIRHEPRAFLQRLCLAWLALLVYGYLGGHAALFPDLTTSAPALSGMLWVALVLFMAKAADLPWALARRFTSQHKWIQLIVSPLGGLVGGVVLGTIVGTAQSSFALLGLLVGVGLGFASRGFAMIATDVLGEDPGRPLKGTALFGIAFALAVAYHFVRYVWT